MKYILFSFLLLVGSCDSGPKVIKQVVADEERVNPHDGISMESGNVSEIHKVVVKEVLPTDKYAYLNVEEDENNFWIAIPKQEVEVGESYVYQGGLLKKNFESKEYNRTFETVYLVSNIRKVNESPNNSMVAGEKNEISKDVKIEHAAGVTPIAELLKNKADLENKTVKISGQCFKVNPNIMGRNWIHLRDGTADDYDLTITSNENIPVGAVVTIEGIVRLNKDFGAGYRYDLIIEDSVLK
jgi:hypothetical protein